MAAYTKIYEFVYELGLGAYNLSTDVLKVALARSTDPPVQTDTVLTDITQPTGTGYTAGGEDSQNTWAEATGTGTLTGTKVVWTAGAADWLSFQYVVMHDDTVTDELVAYWNYGSDVTLGNGETFMVKFNNGDPTGTIFTLA